MALVRNLVANSLNQGVSFLLNIVAVPLYLSQLGAEQYGLIGFALVVQTWVNLLEVGMSGTLGREMTRLTIGDVSEASVHSFLRSLDWLCLAGLILLPSIGWLTRGWWAQEWFTSHTLTPGAIAGSIVLIVALAAVRLAGTLYRGGLIGYDRQVFISAVSIVSSVLRLLVPLPFIWATPDVRIVIGAWLIISIMELIAFRLAISQAFSTRFGWWHFSIAEIRRRAPLWGSIGYAALVWTAITQTDKIVLSRVLPLAEYGRFTLVMILSNAILSIANPIIFAFQPRITSAATRGDREELARLVGNAALIMMVLMMAPAFALAAVPKLAILAWTGKASAVQATSGYLGPYVLGSAMVSLAFIAYAIQYAFGNLKAHLGAFTLFAIILVPGEILVATRFGALGAAWLWFALNLVVVTVYCPFILHRFLPGEARRWYSLIVVPPIVASAAAAWGVASVAKGFAGTRTEAIVGTIATGTAACGAAAVVAFYLGFRERGLRAGAKAQPESEAVNR